MPTPKIDFLSKFFKAFLNRVTKRGSSGQGHAALTFDLILDPSTTLVVAAVRIEMKMRCVALSQNLNIFAPAPPGGAGAGIWPKKPGASVISPRDFYPGVLQTACARTQ